MTTGTKPENKHGFCFNHAVTVNIAEYLSKRNNRTMYFEIRYATDITAAFQNDNCPEVYIVCNAYYIVFGLEWLENEILMQQPAQQFRTEMIKL